MDGWMRCCSMLCDRVTVVCVVCRSVIAALTHSLRVMGIKGNLSPSLRWATTHQCDHPTNPQANSAIVKTRHTDRQTDRQTGRQPDSQTGSSSHPSIRPQTHRHTPHTWSLTSLIHPAGDRLTPHHTMTRRHWRGPCRASQAQHSTAHHRHDRHGTDHRRLRRSIHPSITHHTIHPSHTIH